MHDSDDNASVSSDSQNDTYASLTDKMGNPFDPDYHKLNDDGTPKLTKSGHCMRPQGGKKVAGKKLSEAAQKKTPPHLRNQTKTESYVNVEGAQQMASTADHVQIPENQVKKLTPREAKLAAKATTNTLRKLNVGFGGPTFDFFKDKESGLDERAEHETAFETYYLAKGKADIPPGVALCITMGMFYYARFSQNEIVEQAKKDSKIFGGISRMWAKLKLWRANRKIDKEAAKAGKDNTQAYAAQEPETPDDGN